MIVTIREAKMTDLKSILDLENKYFKQPWKESDWVYELTKNPVNKIYVIEDKQIFGFIDFMITFNSATISQIVIDENHQHMGYAQQLLSSMESTFPSEGEDIVETVTLEVRESNKKALNLYQKNGYEIITKKPHYYLDGEDAIYMVKRLLLCH